MPAKTDKDLGPIRPAAACVTCTHFEWTSRCKGSCSRFHGLAVSAYFTCPEHKPVRSSWLYERASCIGDPALDGWAAAYRRARREKRHESSTAIHNHTRAARAQWDKDHPRPPHSYGDNSPYRVWSEARLVETRRLTRIARKALNTKEVLRVWKEQWEQQHPRPPAYIQPPPPEKPFNRFEEVLDDGNQGIQDTVPVKRARGRRPQGTDRKKGYISRGQ